MPRKSKSDAPKPGGFVSTKVEVEGRSETRIVEIPEFEPAPWTDESELTIVGARVPRMDAHEKVTGRARYTADIAPPGMHFATIVRAPIPRGTIRSFDATAARAIPGVLDVLGPGDAPKSTRLFANEIFYAGQPVAAICATSLVIAERAARAIAIEYDAAPFAPDFASAVAEGAPKARPPAMSRRTRRSLFRAATSTPASPPPT